MLFYYVNRELAFVGMRIYQRFYFNCVLVFEIPFCCVEDFEFITNYSSEKKNGSRQDYKALSNYCQY